MNETVLRNCSHLRCPPGDCFYFHHGQEGKKGTQDFRPLIVEQPYGIYLSSCPSSGGLPPFSGGSVHHDIRLPCPGTCGHVRGTCGPHEVDQSPS